MADPAGNHFGPLDVEANPNAEDYTETALYRIEGETGLISGGGVSFSGRAVTLAGSEAKVHGGFFYRDSPTVVTSAATTGANPRRDMLVLRSVLTSGSGASAVGGSTVPVLLQGNPAVTPVDPERQARDEPLWSWQVPGSGGTTLTGQRDLRRPLRKDRMARRLHGFELTKGSAQAVGSGARSAIGFATVVLDSDGYWAGGGATAAIIPPGLGGLMLFSVYLPMNSVTPARYFADLEVGGVRTRVPAYGEGYPVAGFPLRVAAGDTVAVLAYQESGSLQSVQADSRVTAHLIGT